MGNCQGSGPQVTLLRGNSSRLVNDRKETVKRDGKMGDAAIGFKPFSQLTPGELKLLGISVHYLSTQFMTEVRDAGLNETSKIYQIEDLDIEQDGVIRRKGARVSCPIDNKEGAAYVHSITDTNDIGTADVMLSYTWGDSIADIVDTLVGYCQSDGLNPKKTFVWICCLCVNQHRVVEGNRRGEDVPFDEFQLAIEERVASIGHVISMIAPWQAPNYFTRVWCIFEIFTASENDCEITLYMPSREKHNFMHGIRGDNMIDQVNELLTGVSNTNVRKAHASVESDRANIIRLIKDHAGCDKFDAKVSAKMRTCALNFIASEVIAGSRGLEDRKSKFQQGILLNNVAEYLYQLGEYDQLLAVGKEGIRINESVHGWENKHTAKSIYLVGCGLYSSEGNTDEAMRLQKEALEIRERILGRDDVDTADSMMIIASMLDWKGEKEKAMRMYKDALEIREKIFGRKHAKTAETLSFIATMLDEKGAVEEALKLYEEVVGIQKKIFGREHRNTATTISNIANVIYEQGKKGEALIMFNEVLAIYDKELGSEHHLTASARYWVDRISREIGSQRGCFIM